MPKPTTTRTTVAPPRSHPPPLLLGAHGLLAFLVACGDTADGPGARTAGTGRAFEPRLDFDLLADGRLALIDSIGYRVKLIGLDGSVTGTIERPIAPLPVDDAIREAERERYREGNGAVLESGTRFNIRIEREGAEERTFADDVPVLYGLKVDWENRIWLARRGPTGQDDGPTDIVTPGGDYIGTAAAGRPPDAGRLRSRRSHGLHRARRDGRSDRARGQAGGAGTRRVGRALPARITARCESR